MRDRIDEVADGAGIEPLLGRETHALSGGERQLLAVAGILMMQPRLYVVDEPLANLDPATAAAPARRSCAALADAGDAVVIVEHRVEEALDLRPDRVLYLEDGATALPRPTRGVPGDRRPATRSSCRSRSSCGASGRRLTRAPRTEADAEAPGAPSARCRGAGRTGVRRHAAGRDRPPRVPRRPRRHRASTRSCMASTRDLGPDEVVAILGPNGSGKTTLFRTAMRLLPVTRGHDPHRRRADRRADDRASSRTEFGYVFQSPSQMLFSRTVEEELLFGPRNLGPRSGDLRRAASPTASRARRSMRVEDIRDAAAAGALVRPAEAARPRDRARAPTRRR